MSDHLFLGDSTYPHQSLVSELRNFGATIAELRAADRIEQLERDNDNLAKALADDQIAKTLIVDLNIRNGINLSTQGGMAGVIANIFADQFRSSGAINYLELIMKASDGLELVVTMQKKDGKTPTQLRHEAEEKVTHLERELADAQKGHARYEYMRKLNVRQFQEIFICNLSGEYHFDDLIDAAISEVKK